MERAMKVKVAKWGNSLGVRLPKAAAAAAGLRAGAEVDVVVEGGDLRLKSPLRTSRQLLEEMVAEMKRLGPENQPEMVDWGPDVGAEIIDDAYSRGEITLDDILKGDRTDKRKKPMRKAMTNALSRRRRHRLG
jgi:antitoxin MazE